MASTEFTAVAKSGIKKRMCDDFHSEYGILLAQRRSTARIVIQ